MSGDEKKVGVLFVCLGNICRSPIGEAVFADLVKKRGLEQKYFWDSAGTGGWHVGSKPDRRAQSVLRGHDITTPHRARQITKEDFTTYDYIFGMDENNIKTLNRMAPKTFTAKIELLGKYHPSGETIIEDPYYESGNEAFEVNYDQCLKSCQAFLDQLEK